MRFLGKAWIFVLLAAVLMLAAAACGEEPPANEGETGGATGGGATAETTEAAVDSEFQGVVDSYAIASEEIDAEGGEKEVGQYRVGYIVEPAEGWWEGDPGNLEWREPAAGETNHIEILPYDPKTGLFIPYMDINLAVLDESGQEVDRQELSFYWAEFLHYANNFSLPESGTYTLRAELEPPEFRRHGDEKTGEGNVFTEPVTVGFENVEINPGEE